MKKEFLFLTILLFTSRLATAQAPGIEWQKSLGGRAADALVGTLVVLQ